MTTVQDLIDQLNALPDFVRSRKIEIGMHDGEGGLDSTGEIEIIQSGTVVLCGSFPDIQDYQETISKLEEEIADLEDEIAELKEAE